MAPISYEMMSPHKISKYVFRPISRAKIAHCDYYVKPTNGQTDIGFGHALTLISKVVRTICFFYFILISESQLDSTTFPPNQSPFALNVFSFV